MKEREIMERPLAGQLIFSSRRRVCRYESLSAYNIPEEQAAYRQFLAGKSIEWPAELEEFLQAVDDDIRKGVEHIRVRLITKPLTDYIRFEVEFYKRFVSIGMKIRIVDGTKFARTRFPSEDFYVFDADRVAVLDYDATGKWLGDHEAIGDARDRYLAHWNSLESLSVPFQTYLESVDVSSPANRR